jgi:hypothetical protein
VLFEQLAGLLGARYFPNAVGKVTLVVYELEDGVFLVGCPRFLGGYDRDPVLVIPDD